MTTAAGHKERGIRCVSIDIESSDNRKFTQINDIISIPLTSVAANWVDALEARKKRAIFMI